MDVRKWPIFGFMEANMLSNIRRAWVFYSRGYITSSDDGESNLSVLFTTKDNVVWGFGNFRSFIETGCFGNPGTILKPLLISCLENVKIERFSFGQEFMIGITEPGQLIQCGSDEFIQQGCGRQLSKFNPYYIGAGVLDKVKFVEVECGLHHALALSSNGRVYAWGCNSSRQCHPSEYDDSNVTRPREVKHIPINKTTSVTSISCGPSSSYAVLNDGRVYMWGKNHIDAIIGVPEQIASFADDFILKIVCGLEHTLALNKHGDLYTWGRNHFGQLGTGNQSNCLFPRKISWNYGRIINIAAIRTSRISVAVTNNSEIYVWGLCGGFKILEPQLSQYKTIQEVFCNLSNPAESYGFIENVDFSGSIVQQNSINHTLEAAFNDLESSDFKILIDDQEIHVHKTILILRSKYFQRLFAGDWKEGKENVMTVKNRTYTVYEAFLKYLYTDRVDVSLEDTFELLNIAEEYLHQNLKEICVETIKRETTVENVASLFAKAYPTDMDEYKQFCLSFIFKRMNSVTQSQGFKNSESNIQLEIYQKASENNLFKT